MELLIILMALGFKFYMAQEIFGYSLCIRKQNKYIAKICWLFHETTEVYYQLL